MQGRTIPRPLAGFLFSVSTMACAAAQPADVPVGNKINTHAAAPPADVLVVNKSKTNGNLPGSLSFLDLTSGKVAAHVPVGREPHEVAVSADGRYAVVSNTGSNKEPGNSLSVFDVAKREEIHRVDLGPLWNPHGLLASNGFFYFTAEGARAIGAYDPVRNRLAWVMGTGQDQTHMLAATKDGKTLVATNRGSGTVSIFQLTKPDPLAAEAWKETILPVGRNPEGIDVNPEGTQAWVGCRGGNEIAIVDLAQQKVVDRFTTPNQPIARVKFALEGKLLLATDPWHGDLLFIDPTSHQTLKSVPMGRGCEAIFVEPDGKHALIGVTNEDNVAEVDLATMSVVRRLSAGQGPDGMAWIGK
ncbi:YncE family protein [Polyangium mundeleinium]|uniref:YncE family protein n=1 Tax=Polyangium mundeleinium TaxID=2995306 RepID=A0ABT5ERR6_9BACT|nr:YncE family protein [Polyangium mundeleinium]MDC0744512.1 YncE family protein [Polyangium mundeleinium]